ncbi:MAG: response regulator transcription factor, partial [Henriciella sp.]|nr:response regulator transcription factor [Henriciella sp.]
MSLDATSETHVLIVDDDDRIRDLTRQFLAREGHRVTTAQDAASARKLFQPFSFDLAILDIMMPGESGLSLLSALREEGNITPVLLLTARGQASDRIEGLRLGADDYLPKPFEPEELALRAAAILRRSHVPPPPGEIEMSGLVFNVARGELTGPEGRVRLTESERQLLTLLADPRTTLDAKRFVCGSLGKMGSAACVAPLAGLLADGDLAEAAWFGLARIPAPAAASAMAAGLEQAKKPVRR